MARMLMKFFGAEASCPEFSPLGAIGVLARGAVEMVESAARLTGPKVLLASLASYERRLRSAETTGAMGAGLLQSQSAFGAEFVVGLLLRFFTLRTS